MKRHLFLITLFFLNYSYSQKVIVMEKINGVFQIPCKVNGIPMKFIFDTGASNVTISITEAKFLIKQGLIKKEDFIENVNYQIANGEIKEGTQINIKSIEIEGVVLNNIVSTVVYEQNAPLLLGQTAISKLGTFTIKDNNLIIDGLKSDTVESNYTKEINGTFDWIKRQIQFYQYEDKFEKNEYFFKLQENVTGGFSLFGNTTVTIDNKSDSQIFILPIHKILDIHFQIDKENKDIIFLIVEANSTADDLPFMIDDEHKSKFFLFTLHEYLNEENMQERLKNAFDNLIKYNNLLVKLNNKF